MTTLAEMKAALEADLMRQQEEREATGWRVDIATGDFPWALIGSSGAWHGGYKTEEQAQSVADKLNAMTPEDWLENESTLQARYAKLEAAARDALKFLHIVDQGGGWNCDDDERAAVAIAKALRSVVDGGADE